MRGFRKDVKCGELLAALNCSSVSNDSATIFAVTKIIRICYGAQGCKNNELQGINR